MNSLWSFLSISEIKEPIDRRGLESFELFLGLKSSSECSLYGFLAEFILFSLRYYSERFVIGRNSEPLGGIFGYSYNING